MKVRKLMILSVLPALCFGACSKKSPTAPNPYVIVGSLMLSRAHDVYVSGSYAYVASGTGYPGLPGLCVVDVTNPSNPTLVGQGYQPPHVEAQRIVVSGQYVYLTGSSIQAPFEDTLFVIYDVSNPSQPRRVGGCRLRSPNTYDVKVSGQYAYVAEGQGVNGNGYVEIIDVSDVSNPRVAVACSLQWSPCFGLSIPSSSILCAIGLRTLYLIDIKNPLTPTILGSCNFPGGGSGVFATGSYAYVVNNIGLEVINLADINFPYTAGRESLTTSSTPVTVVVTGKQAYVAAYNQKVYVVDVQNPSHPKLMNVINTPNHGVAGLFVANGYLYLADDPALVVVRLPN